MPRIGKWDFAPRGGLTAGEDELISELSADAPDSFVAAAKAADAIATAEGITIEEAYKLVSKLAESGCDGSDVSVKHAALIANVRRAYRASGTIWMRATVTAMVRRRAGVASFTMEDAMDLSRGIYRKIYDFAQAEVAAENQPEEEPSAEELGKQQPEPEADQ